MEYDKARETFWQLFRVPIMQILSYNKDIVGRYKYKNV